MAGSSSALTPSEVRAGLSSLPGWSYKDDKLQRELEFGSFREAVSFIARIAFEAEEMNHHPELFNVYSTVRIGLTTHDAGDKVTSKDLELARRIEQIVWI